MSADIKEDYLSHYLFNHALVVNDSDPVESRCPDRRTNRRWWADTRVGGANRTSDVSGCSRWSSGQINRLSTAPSVSSVTPRRNIRATTRGVPRATDFSSRLNIRIITPREKWKRWGSQSLVMQHAAIIQYIEILLHTRLSRSRDIT